MTSAFAGLLRAEKDQLHWNLFTKPLDLFIYLPRSSNHPQSVFQGLMRGGVIRIQRRCTDTERFTLEVARFRQRLRDGGYSSEEIDKAFRRAKGKRPLEQNCVKARLKHKFSSESQLAFFRRGVKKYAGLLKQAFGGPAVVHLAVGVHPSNFLRSCSRNWQQPGGKEELFKQKSAA